MALTHLSVLSVHPTTPTSQVETLNVELSLSSDGAWNLRYDLAGDLAGLRIPTPHAAERCDGLWRHTCFELFVGSSGTSAYREFNFSPSGQWQAYAFHAYRAGDVLEPALAPVIATEHRAGHLIVAVRVPPDDLSPGQGPRIGLSAVLEDRDGGLSYWALRHAPGKPDFHHPDTFALEIDLREIPS